MDSDYELSEETFRVILASIHDVFPHVVVFRPVVGDVVVLASQRPIQIPWEIFRKRFSDDRAFASFERVGIVKPDQIFFISTPPKMSSAGSLQILPSATLTTTSGSIPDALHMVEVGAAQTSEEHGIGIALLRNGSEQRLEAFEKMLPAVPVDALVREALAYQYGMEPGRSDRRGRGSVGACAHFGCAGSPLSDSSSGQS